jgi:AcrR family transcriptional regulator
MARNYKNTSANKAPAKGASARRVPLGRDAWLSAAREALIREGVRGIEIGKLARKLKVTRGGFYWFFDSHKQLLAELLADWERTNSAPFKAVLGGPAPKNMTHYQQVVRVWVDETGYSPAWDSAVRDWARVSPEAAAAVRRADDERIGLLTLMFRDLGHDDDEALVRARVMYFHQVGYYAMGVRESRKRRLQLLPLYTKIITGRRP